MTPGDSSHNKTAPQPLYLVQRFVNSVDLESGEDELESPEALRDWFAERGLMDAGDAVGPADLRRAVDVREGLRAVLRHNNGLPLDEERVERLDRAVRRAGVRVEFAPGREPALVPDAAGVDGAIARLMAIVAAAVEHGRWERLKACPREACEWAFYDKSKNRSGRWCKMETCGNIEKAKAFRERRRS
jgi:predicted RNA-binding Zn ribbon-like protein